MAIGGSFGGNMRSLLSACVLHSTACVDNQPNMRDTDMPSVHLLWGELILLNVDFLLIKY